MNKDNIIIKPQQRFRSDHHRVYTEEVNKIALSSNNDKRLQTYDKLTTYPYETNAFKVCESEMRYVQLKKIIFNLLKHAKMKRVIKREPTFKNESQQTGRDMLLMYEKDTRGGMCHAIYRYAEANNKYMMNHDKNKESSYLEYSDANNLYGRPMCKKLPVRDFK